MKNTLSIALLTCCGLALPVASLYAEPAPAAAPALLDDDGPKPAEWAKTLKTLNEATGRLEVTVQYDKGESPGYDYAAYYAAMMGMSGTSNDASADESAAANWDQLIKDERPAERACWFLSPTRVISADIALHPRFIKSIGVRVGDKLIPAKPVQYFRTQGLVVFELAEPAPAAVKPLAFDAAKEGPFFAVRHAYRDGAWITASSPLGGGTSVTSDGRAYTRVAGDILIVDKSGAPVGMWANTEMPLDGSWKGSPEKWPGLSEDEMTNLLKSLDESCGKSVLRCVANFRSPRQDSGGYGGRYGGMMGGMMGEYGQPESGMTEWNGTALVIDSSTAIVLANFKPRTTSRLEKIRLFTQDGQSVTATFDGTLKDYGGFLVKLEKPIGTPAAFAPGEVTGYRGQLLLKSDVKVRGETRTAYLLRDRIDGFQVGWRRQLFPAVGSGSGQMESYYSRGENAEGQTLTFLYTTDGKLIAAPLQRRSRVTADDQRMGYSYSSGRAGVLTPVGQISSILADRKAAVDVENRPLGEDEENRIAWLGTELQSLGADLARANNVVELTRNGQSGALVTYVYENSPAAKAGIEVGDILLRLHVEDEPKPLEVAGEGMGGFGDFSQIYAMMDRMPSEYFDQMPSPFGAGETMLTRSLTDIGFGRKFRAEVFKNGKVEFKDMVITQGPEYYNSAKRFKSEAGGLTVRNLTYEVRRHMQLKADDPGVIISKVERGEKAAIAGVKPYELITAVNDKPVTNTAEFEAAIKEGGEFRFNVKRMTTGRIVKVKLDSEATAKEKAKNKPKKNPADLMGEEGMEMPAMPGFPGGR